MKNPPKHLDPAARRWWAALQREYGIDDAGGLSLLSAAADAWQRARQAREIVAKEGPVITDRFGQPQPHPAVRIEHGARAQLLQALKLLNFDLEPAKPPGRPGGDFHFGG
jgi:P27 family predicted phage terminase small subunit